MNFIDNKKKKRKIKFKKYIFNVVTFFIYKNILNKKIPIKKYMFLNRNLIEMRKKNFFYNIIHNYYSNLIRFYNIDNYREIKKNIYIDYFKLTKTNFFKKNIFYKSINKNKFKNFDYFCLKNKNIIHIGSSTSFNNFHQKNKFKNKNYYQIDLNPKITTLNKQLFKNNKIHSLTMDILQLPKFLFLNRMEKILIYSSATLAYVPPKKIKLFLHNLKRIKKIDLFLSETKSQQYEKLYHFDNPILFMHDYEKIFKETGWYYDRTFSNKKNISVARNYL